MNSSFRIPIAGLTLAATLLCACQNVPQYKHSGGKYDEWKSYDQKTYQPSNGTIVAVDSAAGAVTILRGKNKKVFTVTPATRIMHQGQAITLAQLPLNQVVKYTLAPGSTELRTIWYGHLLNANQQHPGAHQEQNTFFQ